MNCFNIYCSIYGSYHCRRLFRKINNQYDLVLLARERTSQLNSGAEMLVEKDNDKNTVIALREIGEGKVDPEELKKNAVLRLRERTK